MSHTSPVNSPAFESALIKHLAWLREDIANHAVEEILQHSPPWPQASARKPRKATSS